MGQVVRLQQKAAERERLRVVVQGAGRMVHAVDAIGHQRAYRVDISCGEGNVDDAIHQLMRAVVVSGTGTAANVNAGGPVYGKTGTAEFGPGNPPATHAWFIGFRGDVAFAVLVEGGGVGGQVAAPIEVVARRGLGRNVSIAVVRAGGKALVLGMTDSSVRVLAEADPDSIETVAMSRAPSRGPSSSSDGRFLPGTLLASRYRIISRLDWRANWRDLR